MSNVIAFRRETKDRSAVRPHAEAGQILLFTGVRYIRDEDDDQPDMAAVPPAAKVTQRPGAPIERLQA